MKKPLALALAALALALAPLAAPADAQACGGALWEERVFVAPKPSPPKLVAEGEKALDGGDTRKALASVTSAYGDVAKAEPGKDALKNRALRIAALAVVRGKGQVAVAGQGKATAEERLAWAAKKLEALAAQDPSNPTLEGDLGEALAAAGRSPEAYTHLAKLAEKDLLGSAQGYAALARLQFAAGLTSKSAKALSRCEAMAADRTVCGLPKVESKGAVAGKGADSTPKS